MPFKPSKNIALAINGDVINVLEKSISRLKSATQIDQYLQLQRAAARKLIRATNILRTDSDSDWPETLDEHVSRFSKKYPPMAADLAWFLHQALTPDGKTAAFIIRLRRFMMWLSRHCNDLRYNRQPDSVIRREQR